MKATDYSVLIIWSKEDEAFLAQVHELPGCVADGATREEALANATIAAENWIETAKEIGREIPEPMPLDRFERPAKDELEAQLRKAVESELQSIIPDLVAQIQSDVVQRVQAGIYYPSAREWLAFKSQFRSAEHPSGSVGMPITPSAPRLRRPAAKR
jgi:predicted RNase H-like HicB family nuclease